MSATRDMERDNDIHLFLVSEKCVMSPKFHTKFSLAGKLQRYHVTYTFSSVTPGSVGNRRVFSDIENGDWYLKSEIKLVPVNWKTRRPTKFPKTFYENTCKLIDNEHMPMITRRQEALIPPDISFKTSVQTRYSDMDFNLHVSYAEYYRFSCDAAAEASLSGYYRHFNSDIVNYPILQTEATFLGECGPEELLLVYTWQDEKDLEKIYFAIYLKDVRIFQACFIYDNKKSHDHVMSSL
ncbi:uncharacterized protein LOC132554626 [Ylistrum balloti]|uniref:uncharacterized protein LOC132554626 n=1 Tax=Ylistrum balloti TaxID=509963 RepID=UPI002905934C|nr:uncharacterized protein LOC132554626 [Ylistrum balloti]